MRARYWLAVIIVMICTSTIPYSVKAFTHVGTISYGIQVIPEDYSSVVDVELEIDVEGSWSVWLAVPKGLDIEKIRVSGSQVGVAIKPLIIDFEENPFYSNLTVYGVNAAHVTLNYTHPYTLLVGDRKGLFLSPLLMFSTILDSHVNIEIPFSPIDILESEPYPVNTHSSQGKTILEFVNIKSTRIAMILRLDFEGKSVTLEKGEIRFEVPKLYVNAVEPVLDYVEDIYRTNFTDLFSLDMGIIRFHFYVPDRLNELPIGGYTPYMGKTMGDIYVNLLYLRGLEGQLELISLHELVHRMLHKAGIQPDPLLWVHEGFAEYLSTTVAVNFPAAKRRIDDLNTVAKYLKGNYGFVEDWRPGQRVENIGKYYAASYAVISQLAEMYGGFKLYQKFFQLLKSETVKNTADFIRVISMAAGTNLTSVFKSWGFESAEWPSIPPLLIRARSLSDDIPWWLQPVSAIAKWFTDMAEASYEAGRERQAVFYAVLAIALAENYVISEILIITLLIALIMGVLFALKLSKSRNYEYPYDDSYECYTYYSH